MFFSRISVFVVATLGLLAAAAPAAVEKRASSVDTITSALTTLKGTADTIVPQLTALQTSGQLTQANAAPLVSQLTSAITTAQTKTTGLSPVSDSADVSTIADPLALLLAELNVLLAGITGDVVILLNTVTIDLQELLLTLEVVVPGILAAVDGLLVTLGVTLGSVLGGLLGGLLGIL